MLEPRAPIVTVMGHVDHGKTTLLDAIRKTNVAGKEAGGITQSIGASQISVKASGSEGLRPGGSKKITFIDTPGHAAFSLMRSRGAKVADIAILVVAADDGVKPQTKEALEFILEEKIPYIVAITKTDLMSAEPERVKRELENIGVLFEGSGGNVPSINISAKLGKGIDDLLEMITLVAEVNEINTDSKADLEAFVVETHKDNRGILASIIVRSGSLKVGGKILVEGRLVKIRGIFTDGNRKVTSLGPGEPGLVLGFDEAPQVGSQLRPWKEDSVVVKETHELQIGKQVSENTELNIIIKTLSAGTLEAIKENLANGVNVISSGIGDVNEGDVFSAKTTLNCRIFAFESKVPSHVKKLADTEGVKIEEFDIVYKLFERLEELMAKTAEEILGKAEIVAIFPYNNKKVAGCKAKEGKISKGDFLKLLRNDKEIGSAKIITMKREKKDITQALAGEEFGVVLEPQLDFTIGDMLISVRK